MHDAYRRPSHHSWLSFDRYVPPDLGRVTVRMIGHTHCFFHVRTGYARGRYVHGGRECATSGETGSVRVHPPDHQEHFLDGIISPDGVGFSVLMIPPEDFHAIQSAEGVVRAPEWRTQVWDRDAILQSCMRALTCNCPADQGCEDDRDEAACTLVLRAAELMGAGKPDWHADGSHFSGHVLGQLVAAIDSSLKIAPSGSDLALLVGLSPGHFTRKFRNTTGSSLHRFVNRRRIREALGLLKDHSRPLAHVALDLGFSSQSHFTRLFSDLTGMTPARYRRQFRRTTA